MQALAKLGSVVALALTIVPPMFFMFGALGEAPLKHMMLAGFVLWFASAPFAMKGGAQ